METTNPLDALGPSARHMRKRRFGADTPSPMAASSRALMPSATPRARPKASHQTKRAVALLIVILVAISLPLLVVALIFAQ